MRRIISVLLLLTALLTVVGCSGGSDVSESFNESSKAVGSDNGNNSDVTDGFSWFDDDEYDEDDYEDREDLPILAKIAAPSVKVDVSSMTAAQKSEYIETLNSNLARCSVAPREDGIYFYGGRNQDFAPEVVSVVGADGKHVRFARHTEVLEYYFVPLLGEKVKKPISKIKDKYTPFYICEEGAVYCEQYEADAEKEDDEDRYSIYYWDYKTEKAELISKGTGYAWGVYLYNGSIWAVIYENEQNLTLYAWDTSGKKKKNHRFNTDDMTYDDFIFRDGKVYYGCYDIDQHIFCSLDPFTDKEQELASHSYGAFHYIIGDVIYWESAEAFENEDGEEMFRYRLNKLEKGKNTTFDVNKTLGMEDDHCFFNVITWWNGVLIAEVNYVTQLDIVAKITPDGEVVCAWQPQDYENIK
ncbi:MAG: hypothetical protein IJY56_00360 [Clostridia bacterium]|nr:hypothetical protein [Clostridia bacterium]